MAILGKVGGTPLAEEKDTAAMSRFKVHPRWNCFRHVFGAFRLVNISI
jgi:hypothetical protein